MGLTNKRAFVLKPYQFTLIKEAYPDTRFGTYLASDGIPQAISKSWGIIQGEVRDGPEIVILASFAETDIQEQLERKAVYMSIPDGDRFEFQTGPLFQRGEYNSQLALNVASAAFDTSTVTYNTRPNLSQVATMWLSAMGANGNYAVIPSSWDPSDRVMAPESLIQAINNGIAFSIYSSNPVPLDAEAVNFTSSLSLQMNAVSLLLHIYDIQLEAENLSPANGGYAAPNEALEVSWTVGVTKGWFNVEPAQASFVVEYTTRKAGQTSASKTLSGTTDTTATIPAIDLDGVEGVSWRVKLTSDDGVEGVWSAWQALTCVDQTGKAVALSPSDANVSAGETVTFLWEHSSVSGLPQAGVRIRVQPSGGTWVTVYEGSTTDRRAALVLPSEVTATAGQAAWAVQTRDSRGNWSEWSDPLYLYIVAAAQAPVVSSVSEGTARPVVAWQSANQTGYQVRIRDDGGTVVYDSGVVAGAEQSHQVADYLPDGAYVAAVVVWNQYAIESGEGTRSFTVEAPVLAAPIIFCGSVEGGVRILLQSCPTCTRAVLYRDGTPVQVLTGTETVAFDWMAGLGSHAYRLRAETGDAFSDSGEAWASPLLRCPLLAAADAPEDWVPLRLNRDRAPQHSDRLTVDATMRTFQGRRLPVAEFSGQEQRSHSHSFSLRRAGDLEQLERLACAKKPLLYRDQFGRRYFCVCTSLPVDYDRHAADVSLTLDEVDYQEAVEK